MRVETIATAELGDRSYIVIDGDDAVVIDPQRDIDRMLNLLEQFEVQPAFVLETHIHNDYVTGGLALANATGAQYGVAAEDAVRFDRLALADGDLLRCGALSITVVATPGHTKTHLAFIIEDSDGRRALFSGGSLLYGSVGRTDLLGQELTEDLTHAQFRSTRHLAEMLDDDVELFPTHGFGSFCSSGGATGGTSSTIGIERERNDVLLATDEDSFVRQLIANLTAYPAYYAHMGPLNLLGPAAPNLSPIRSVDPEELARRIRDREWVLDLREVERFAVHHLDGTISMAIGNNFSTYVGWLIPWGAPITLIAESETAVREAQRQLVRIGIDRVVGSSSGSLETLSPAIPVAHYQVVKFSELPPLETITVVDVRRDDERATGSIPHSIHIPLNELVNRTSDLPQKTLWIHCASGYRAAIAASLLARSGHDVVLINDDFAAATTLRLASA